MSLIAFFRRWTCDHDFIVEHGVAQRMMAWEWIYNNQPLTIFFCKKCGKLKKVWC